MATRRSRLLLELAWFLLVTCFGNSSANAADTRAFPPLVVPHTFGVNVHSISDSELDTIAAAGFRFVRTDFRWDKTELTKGVYDWSYYDALSAALQARGLTPLYILDYSNPLYASRVDVTDRTGRTTPLTSAPVSEVAVKAFADWAVAAATHFSRYDPVWEIWNEPEGDKFWPPQANASQYSNLAIQTCRRLRAADPAALIIAPASAKPPTVDNPEPPFLDAVMRSGILECLSGVSAHPYLPRRDLDDTPKDWDALNKMIDKYRAGTRRLSIVSSESGISTFGTAFVASRVAEENIQAAYAVRMMLLNFVSGVAISIWYDWRDDGTDPANPEHHFGLVHVDLSPKPVLAALTKLNREFSGYRFECRDLSAAPITLLLFRQQGANERAVVWAAQDGQTVRLKDDGSIDRILSMAGQEIPIQRSDETSVTLPVGSQPIYLEFRGEAVGKFCRAPILRNQ